MATSPKRASTKPKRQLKVGRKRFNLGILAIIVVSLVAIAVLFVAVSHASYASPALTPCNNGNVRWLGQIVPDCAHYSNMLNTGVVNEYIWWGPYTSLYIPAPSGYTFQECMVAGIVGNGTVYAKLDMSSDNGKIIWGQHTFALNNNDRSDIRCYNFRLPEGGSLSYGLTLNNVEFRVARTGYVGSSYLWVNSVSLHSL